MDLGAAFRTTVQVLTGNRQPDHRSIREVRRRNLEALRDLLVQILRLCQQAGMLSLGHLI